MFKFTPMSEAESLNLLPKGEYQAQVKSCEPERSKNSGKEQLKLTLIVYDVEGKQHLINDYVSEHYLQYKLRHLLICCFGEEAYKAGMIDPALIEGKSFAVKVFVQEDKEGKYQPKNAIADYLSLDNTAKQILDGLNNALPFNDAVPF